MSCDTINIGDIIEIRTEGIAYGGDAVARHEGAVIFIPYAGPDERLVIRITEQKRNFFRGEIVEVLQPSAHRRNPPCEYFGKCGGCQLQHLDYPAQLHAKEGFIRDALLRIGRIDWQLPINVRPSPELGYRCRARFRLESISDDHGSKKIVVGFNEAKSGLICDISFCPVQSKYLNEALADLRMIRGSWNELPPEVEAAAGDSGYSIQPAVPGLPSGRAEFLVGDITYSFEPSIFFQSNSELLREFVEAVTADKKGSLAVDLYAGAGLFTLALARSFKKVIGVESDSSAIRTAVDNAEANQIRNVRMKKANVEEWLKNFVLRSRQGIAEIPDLVVLDPPRKGASHAIKDIARMNSPKIVYVSCDPTTLARDLRVLIDNGYVLVDLVGFDFFPQTYHVETVVKLGRA